MGDIQGDQRAGVIADQIDRLLDAEAVEQADHGVGVVVDSGLFIRGVGIAEAGAVGRQGQAIAAKVAEEPLVDAARMRAHVEAHHRRTAGVRRGAGDAQVHLPAAHVLILPPHGRLGVCHDARLGTGRRRGNRPRQVAFPVGVTIYGQSPTSAGYERVSMGEVIRFGILRVGRHWAVVTDHGDRANYASREQAIEAARQMAEVQRGFGRTVELLAQGETFDIEVGPLARRPDASEGEGRAG